MGKASEMQQDSGSASSALVAVGAAVWRRMCAVGSAIAGIIRWGARLKFW